MNKPKVGQVLYSLNVGNAARNREQKLTKVIVRKVGRKYFTCSPEEWTRATVQYNVSDWEENTKYCQDSELYESEKEYEDEKEDCEISRMINEYFEYGKNKHKIHLESLRSIKSIIDSSIKKRFK